MARLPQSRSWSIEQLLEAVEHLSPTEQHEFQSRLASRKAANSSPECDETTLARAAQARLPAASERRLRKLIDRSERGQLTPHELAEYQSLARESQRIDAAKIEALAELARRRGQSVRTVKASLDREGRTDGA
jgi:hypothetical protein